jgi:hypothetical protein
MWSSLSHILGALKDSEAWVVSKRPEYRGILRQTGQGLLFIDWNLVFPPYHVFDHEILAALQEMERWAKEVNDETWKIWPIEEHLERFAVARSAQAKVE